jgi:hypothetical protein
LTHLGPPSCRRQTSAGYARPQAPFGALRRQRHLTTLHGEEPGHAHPSGRKVGCAGGAGGLPARARQGREDAELAAARAEIARLGETVKEQAIELALLRGKSRWEAASSRACKPPHRLRCCGWSTRPSPRGSPHRLPAGRCRSASGGSTVGRPGGAAGTLAGRLPAAARSTGCSQLPAPSSHDLAILAHQHVELVEMCSEEPVNRTMSRPVEIAT